MKHQQQCHVCPCACLYCRLMALATKDLTRFSSSIATSHSRRLQTARRVLSRDHYSHFPKNCLVRLSIPPLSTSISGHVWWQCLQLASHSSNEAVTAPTTLWQIICLVCSECDCCMTVTWAVECCILQHECSGCVCYGIRPSNRSMDLLHCQLPMLWVEISWK